MTWESQLLLLLSPAAILIAALITWGWHRKIAARDATLKFIAEKEIHNCQWRQARSDFYSHAKGSTLSQSQQDSDCSVWLVLHHYELVAVGIETKSLDEKLYKQWNRTNYVKTWKRAASFVDERRDKSGQSTMFCEFEKIATKWERETNKKHWISRR